MNLKESYNYSEMEFKKKHDFDPSIAENDFITEKMLLEPLYKKIHVDKKMKAYNFFPCNDVRIECYCKECNSRRIFSFNNSAIAMNSLLAGCTPGSLTSGSTYIPHDSLESVFPTIDFFTFHAMADCQHKMIIHFMKVDNETIMKIGQNPSIYDLNENINNKKFLKMLGKEYAEYYKSACSLYSFSTYIGALIYLRRIFEKILIDVFNENIETIEMDFDTFKKERMEDKIKILKPYLPSIMFNQGFNTIYTKISDGVHNLTEEECSSMFLVLKMGIEEILTKKMEMDEEKKRIKDLEKQLQNIKNEGERE